ncbi:GMC family oxidoreductase [Natronospirillum operosum]|uniref:Cholesterol oxidase n=1 Tax=Natronospirillum operosum TaxID=2759953 RepID=A0A4Z0WBG2_9GAMM|nr:GMC family oxidoreductase [Natronospirillum operosum]TGG96029.1 GMC family oxidoreductase [Natronospirillum operosum]
MADEQGGAGQSDYDVVIVGSGFGGSVAALRLVEKGYRVLVLEAGRRFDERSLPRTSWQLRSFLWAPWLGCLGIQRLTLLRNAFILSGAGVGGGSLVYANTLYEPPAPFYQDLQWRHITDWQQELAPHYDQARRMLGVTTNPTRTPSDEAMLAVAEEMGVADTFRSTPVGVWFGAPGQRTADPYFGGKGPERTGCIECGECMTGCRHGAKNTLLTNYLYLAEQAGARVLDRMEVQAIRHLADGRISIEARRSGAPLTRLRRRQRFVAADVILAAGTLGTQRLLHRMQAAGHLPSLSPRLGELTRTNSEAIIGARTFRKGVDYTRGVAITSSFHPTPDTHIEPVRYGRGSNFMGLLTTALADGDRWRFSGWVREWCRHPVGQLRNLILRRWSEQSVIALVMQPLDNSLTCYLKRGLLGRRLTSRQGHGKPNPSWIPAGHDAVRRLARKMGGIPLGSWGDLFNVPMTAHILGGAVIGEGRETGVIDPYHRVHGYPNLHVVDGAAISANLGVNPSLTITAQAERALSFWPNRGEVDPRPAPGEPYRRLSPVAPHSPVVPADAPAALRWARGDH